jgi:hypothetical protein
MVRKSTGRAGHEQRMEDMLNTDEKIERKSTGRAGQQEQRLEDCGTRMRRWNGKVQGEQDGRRDCKIC